MHLIATRAQGVTRIALHEGAVVNVDRAWMLAGRELTEDDLHVSRKVHAQLLLRDKALFLYNRHSNRVHVMPGGFVDKGETVRVDGCVLRIGRSAVGDVHLELDVEDARCPPTPLL